MNNCTDRISLHFTDAPYDTSRKTPAEAIYADGRGFMNGVALSAIARQMGLEEPSLPSKTALAAPKAFESSIRATKSRLGPRPRSGPGSRS